MNRDMTTLPWHQTFWWSVRRELWEHRAIWQAPLAVACVILAGFLISTSRLPNAMRAIDTTAAAARAIDPANAKAVTAAALAAARSSNAVEAAYSFMTLGVLLCAILVVMFYALGALHGERRDRSILFWKSLPVSDLTTVLAKAFVPLAIAPALVFAIAFVAHLVMLVWSTVVLLVNGLDPGVLLSHLPFPFLWLALARGLVILTLWYAPVIGWLLLVSVWARRAPILWAIGPLIAMAVFERVAFNSTHLMAAILGHLAEGAAQAFSVDAKGQVPISELADLDPMRFLGSSSLWIGLALTAAFLALAARLRRYRDPI